MSNLYLYLPSLHAISLPYYILNVERLHYLYIYMVNNVSVYVMYTRYCMMYIMFLKYVNIKLCET